MNSLLPKLAHNVSWRSAAACPELGVDRKWSVRCQSDAFDPERKPGQGGADRSPAAK
jgi:hypothetical protein